jgi:hypothetical protein
MNHDEIVAIQKKIGVVADGFFGPKSIAAAKRHLRELMPNALIWPATDQKSLSAFYGAAGDESKLVNLPVTGLGVEYEGQAVKTIRCHTRVANSLHNVLSEISNSQFKPLLKQYAGCFNNRLMRNGSSPSLHARGAAIDLNPNYNGNFQSWPHAANMPFEVMEMFAKEGWISGGAFWGRDAMHHEATQQ